MLFERNFGLLFWGRMVSNIGNAVYQIGIVWYALELTGSAIFMGTIASVTMITYILASPFAGVFVDQHKKVPVLYITDFIRGVTLLILALIISQTANLYVITPALVVTSIINALCGVLFEPATNALIPLILDKERFNKGNSLLSMTGSIANLLGLAIGGIIYGFVGPIGILMVDAISFIGSAISEFFIHIDEAVLHKPSEKEGEKTHPLKQQLNQMKEGLNYIRFKSGLVPLIVLAAALNFAVSPLMQVYHPYLIQETLKKEIIYLTGIEAAISIGMIVAGLMLSIQNRKKDAKKSIVRGSFALTIIFVGIALFVLGILDGRVTFNTFYIIYFVGMLIFGMTVTIINVPIMTYMQETVPHDLLGRVDSVISMFSMVAMPAGLFLGGIIIDRSGIGIAYIVLAIILIATSAYVMLSPALKRIAPVKGIE